MSEYSIPGARVMLVGATGTGKTHAIQTLIEAGITPFVLFTENGMRTLGNVPDESCHWHYIPPAVPSWDAMEDSANKINTFSLKNLADLKTGINKDQYRQFMEVLKTLNNFTCDRCGESFGDVDTWGTDRAIVIDSLSGLNIMAMDLQVGSKPARSPGDWGVAMDNLERFITKMTTAPQCHFILTAHLEREVDEVMGGVQLMASTLGKKLAPKIPRFFDDVIQCVREGSTFTWSTATSGVDLKARDLPWADKLDPSFVQIIEAWKKAGGIIQSTEIAA
jgi:hypothetical protein